MKIPERIKQEEIDNLELEARRKHGDSIMAIDSKFQSDWLGLLTDKFNEIVDYLEVKAEEEE